MTKVPRVHALMMTLVVVAVWMMQTPLVTRKTTKQSASECDCDDNDGDRDVGVVGGGITDNGYDGDDLQRWRCG